MRCNFLEFKSLVTEIPEEGSNFVIENNSLIFMELFVQFSIRGSILVIGRCD